MYPLLYTGSLTKFLCVCNPYPFNMILDHMFRDLWRSGVLWAVSLLQHKLTLSPHIDFFNVYMCASRWECINPFLLDISRIENKCKYLIKISAEQQRWSVRLWDGACLLFAGRITVVLMLRCFGEDKRRAVIRVVRRRPVGLIAVISHGESLWSWIVAAGRYKARYNRWRLHRLQIRII